MEKNNTRETPKKKAEKKVKNQENSWKKKKDFREQRKKNLIEPGKGTTLKGNPDWEVC